MLTAVLLSALVGWSALSLAARARLDGRAETLAAATTLAASMVLAPIYALGLTGRLTRPNLALCAIVLAMAAWVASTIGVGFKGQLRRTAREAAGIARMPWEGILDAWNRRSAVLPCLLACFGLFLWSLAAAYFAPSWRDWDALWYHEPIIGFSIQNHGFAPVDLPHGGIQKINGYPRAGEMLSLWFAIFAGRRLIDLPNALLMPAFFASVYAICRRVTGDRVASAGWAAVACTIPAYVALLQTVQVDPAMATFVLLGALFVLRTPLRAREALVGAAALAIAANIKVSGVFPVVALAVLAVVHMLRSSGPGRRARAVLVLFCGATLIVAFSAATYLGNLHKYHNPVWPDLHVVIPRLGIDWPGNYAWGEQSPSPHAQINFNVPWPQLFRLLLLPPGHPDLHDRKYTSLYGVGFVWVLLPAAVFVVIRIAREVRDTIRGSTKGLDRARLVEVLALVGTAAVTIVMSTNRTAPRYHLATIALWVPTVAWTFRYRRALQGALVFAATIGSLAVIAWEAPGWRSYPGPSEMVGLLKTAAPLREVTPELGAPVLREAGMAREAELVAGTTVVSDDFVFPSVLWNNDYSNRVVYVRPADDLATAADRLGASWVYASDKSAVERMRANGAWSEIGPLYVERWGTAFRRASPRK